MGKDFVLKWIMLAKIAKDRAGGWISFVNYFQLAYLLIITSTHGWELIIIGSIGIVIATVIDMLFILPIEQGWLLRKNTEWQELKKLLKEKKVV